MTVISIGGPMLISNKRWIRKHSLYGNYFDMMALQRDLQSQMQREIIDGDIVITLSRDQLRFIGDVASKRVAENATSSYQGCHGSVEPERYQHHMLGCLGEYAVAVNQSLVWDGSRGQDAGPFEVRTTQMQSGYIPKLRIHPKDPDNKVFILVSVISHAKLRLCGWLMGIEGKRRDRWGSPKILNGVDPEPNWFRPAYWTPATALNPMSTLPSPYDLTSPPLKLAA